MKTHPPFRGESGTPASSSFASRPAERGFAVLVVMVLLVIMVSLAIGNNVALARLKTELQLVERRQKGERWALPTNAHTALRVEAAPSARGTPAAATGRPAVP